ncbi:MAG TPA: acyl-CoA dehydrogenase family protein [Steroidobacteraceae bacterium]|nr:acyl-CoA dehydrogenase family protein [Steroidobacteraceae bacterium]
METFVQSAPQLANQYLDDTFLRSLLSRRLPAEVLFAIEPQLKRVGELAAGELYALQLSDRLNEPRLTHWDAWGTRVDRIELTPLWRRSEALSVELGLTAIPYEQRHGRHSRTHQFALVYLFHPSTDVYTCPLAMTDGAARTLIESGNAALIGRAVPHLTSRDSQTFWTSGQWMTEATGGSDVGAALTTARLAADGSWHLEGKKWFTSAATSQMALTLARPQGNTPGGSGLALFYVETRDAQGRLQAIRIERLKDKLGTRKVPTAELTLEGTPAIAVAGTTHGTRHIAPMLRITRVWNSVCACAFMRRGLALAVDYAQRREAFGARLIDQPLHADTLAGLQAELAGALLMTFELVELLGADEARELQDSGRQLLRLLLPITKLVTGKQVVACASEVLESFGGAGYVEDTGLPVLLRDSQVLPIWEGTTNVLSLDALLRTELQDGLRALVARVDQALAAARDPRLEDPVAVARHLLERASRWVSVPRERDAAQADARRFALVVGRALQLALLIEQAQWSAEQEGNGSVIVLARRFASVPLPAIDAAPPAESRAVLQGLKPAQ